MDITSALTGVLVAAGVAWAPTWRGLRTAVTFVHETGHALASLALGARVKRIKLRFDTSGDTRWEFKGRPGRIRRFLIAGSGYPAPAAAGLAVAWACSQGRQAGTTIAVAAAWLAVTVIWVRSIWGLCYATAVAGIGAGAWWFGHTTVLLTALGWLWLLGATRAAWEMARRNPRRGDESDPGQMASAIPSPAWFWSATMLIAAAAGAVLGGWLLVRPTA